LKFLAFPCNQFLYQENGNAKDIKQCAGSYGSEFPLFEKCNVNGEQMHPVYAFLQSVFPGKIPWNFGAKFIVDKDGIPQARFGKDSDNWKDVDLTISELLANKPLSKHGDFESSKRDLSVPASEQQGEQQAEKQDQNYIGDDDVVPGADEDQQK